MVILLRVSAGLRVFLQHKSLPPPVRDFRRWEPAGTGEFTCGFFHRFPAGTLCTPEPVLSLIVVMVREIGLGVSGETDSYYIPLNCRICLP